MPGSLTVQIGELSKLAVLLGTTHDNLLIGAGAQVSSGQVGHGSVAAALSEFHTNWDYRRRALGERAGVVGALVLLAAERYAETEALLKGGFDVPMPGANLAPTGQIQGSNGQSLQGGGGQSPQGSSPPLQGGSPNLQGGSTTTQNNAGPTGTGAQGYDLTAEELRAIAPNLSEQEADQIAAHLRVAMAEASINTKARAAAFLAQVAEESDGFQTTTEYASGAEYEGWTSLGNVVPGDGVRYKGRGIIQLTGRANYRAFTQSRPDLGVDFEKYPELVSDPKYAYEVAAWYWTNRGCNALADAGDFEGLTRRINGGLNGYSKRVSYHERALKALR
jgi:predicted chitinase